LTHKIALIVTFPKRGNAPYKASCRLRPQRFFREKRF
jgi:hypothetical protein